MYQSIARNGRPGRPIRPTGMARCRRLAMAALAIAASAGARAGSFTLGDDMEGLWSLNMSAGASWRARAADPRLVAISNGGKAGNGQDDGNLNFKQGEVYSSGSRFTGELQLKKGGLGLFLRGTGWYDFTLKNKNVEHGNWNNGFLPGPLNDAGFDQLSGFSGLALGDAYVYGTFELSDDMPLKVKLGNQVLNWGESTFIPGINAMGAFDLTAAHRPGALVKDILRPLPMLTANLGLSNGASLEGFYQLQWKPTVLDGCGTYWSPADSLNCGGGTVVFGDSLGGDRKQYAGVPILATLPAALLAAVGGGAYANTPINFILNQTAPIKPRDGGQFGLSAHYLAERISTDFGLYAVNYHTRLPSISIVKAPSAGNSIFSGQFGGVLTALSKAFAAQGLAGPAAQFGVLGGIPGVESNWLYNAENIQAAGLSAATTVAGFSVFGEASYTHDVPLQINAADLLVGTIVGIGPQASVGRFARDPAIATGSVLPGYERKNKTQLQLSFLRLLPAVAGASSASVMGEVGVQHWTGIGDPATSTRYGRGFLYGFGPTAALGNTCAGLNGYAAYCENKGYATTSAWGYRLQGELNYADAFAGVNLKPRLFWSHDVKGYSGDGIFVEDRRVLGATLHADYNSRYYTELSYTRFNHTAKYDTMHDRDNYSFVAGVNF